MSYNGWANYETWCIELWISNTPELYQFVTNGIIHGRIRNDSDLYARVSEWVYSTIEFIDKKSYLIGGITGLISDLIQHCFTIADWLSIYESFKED